MKTRWSGKSKKEISAFMKMISDKRWKRISKKKRSLLGRKAVQARWKK